MIAANKEIYNDTVEMPDWKELGLILYNKF